ncbi:uncharacterized protein LOC18429491 isoform X1 [Amborella trichopoda]|uniref:Plus3 domain-containing protein n=3 Tax=Amborella trichopoda TaxID=13333 RepID=W1P179_AMBTC|nr:uncharacterized protein LOC18429491 isoform X1 [Amborella trichopoda]XP_020520011.1 uncharacterized protein LOC18429491 isoform X1 [Amborella trichopoda]ERN01409.1 hypothetical protein AMTR_s00002p00264100 [Amborella trichopoda]|eukprot:XP_006838840.1 uncharacterized protein LOC18429491 isoform X1 [Amborella trichopoda]
MDAALDFVGISGYSSDGSISPRRKSNCFEATELGHVLDPTHQCKRRGLSLSSGAGANAGSGEGIILTPTDPLSELVWSPEIGLKLRCANCSFSQKIPFDLSNNECNSESGKAVISQPQSGELGKCMPVCQFENDEGDQTKGMKSVKNREDPIRSLRDKDNVQEELGFNLALQKHEHTDHSKGTGSEPFTKGKNVGNPHSVSLVDLPRTFASEAAIAEGSEYHPKDLVPYLRTQNFKETEMTSIIYEDTRKIKSVPLSEAMSSPDENDVQDGLPLEDDIDVGVNDDDCRVNNIEAEVEGNDFTNVELNSLALRKEDNFHESVKSSDSGNLLVKGKRERFFEQNSLVENGKIRKLDIETPCPLSAIRQGNSFVIWISNLIKGFPKVRQDDSSASENFTNPFHDSNGHSKSLVVSKNMTDDEGCTRLNFQTLFHARYCPNENVTNIEHHNGAGKLLEPEIASKGRFNKDVSSPALGDFKNNKGALVPASNERPNRQVYHLGANDSAAKKSKDDIVKRRMNIWKDQLHYEQANLNPSSSSPQNFGFESGAAMEPQSVLEKPRSSSNLLSNKSNLFGNMWLSRFSSKSSLIKSDALESKPIERPQKCEKASISSPDCHDASITHKNTIGDQLTSMDSQMGDVYKGRQSCCPNIISKCLLEKLAKVNDTEFQTSSDHHSRSSEHYDCCNSQERRQKVLDNSEETLSVKTCKWEALKNMDPLKAKDLGSPVNLTCFYCGIKGHSLHQCSELFKSRDLLKHIKSYNVTEGSSCFCIVCMQLDHWAIACPYASSRTKSHLAIGASSSFNDTGHKRIQDTYGKDHPLTVLEKRDAPHFENDKELENCTSTRNNPMNNSKLNDMILNSTPLNKDTQERHRFSGGLKVEETTRDSVVIGKRPALSSKENVSRGNEIIQTYKNSCNLLNMRFSDVRRGMLEKIRMIRLSRSDILRWTKAPDLNFQMEGYFLRVKFGKWEEGLGGTGYRAACIAGSSQEGSSSDGSGISVSVNLGGFKCLINCPFISNQDFTEDELMAWWDATVRSNEKLPTEEELNLKLQEKMRWVNSK